MRTRTFVTTLLALLSALPAHAQSSAQPANEQVVVPEVARRDIKLPRFPSKDWSIALFGGSWSTPNFGSSALGGIKLGYHLSEDFFVEAAVGATQVSDESFRQILPGGVFVDDKERLTYYNLSVFFLVAWLIWFIFSDPRGPVASFPYPFVMYLAMMILVGLWQHMFLGDWPFQDLPQPARGIVETVVNLVLVWFIIHVVFYRILGVGFNFFSQVNLEALAAAGQTAIPEACGKTLTLEALTNPAARFGERAVVTFVLIGFFSYPFVTILFAKWPIRPSDLTQPQAGLAEFGWCSLLTLFFFTVLIVPFWGVVYGHQGLWELLRLKFSLVGGDCRHRSRALRLWLVLLQPTTPTNKIRDVFIIIVAIESGVIGVALVVLIVQLAALINLLQNEVKPILIATNETVNTLRGTTEFLSENVVEPVIKLNGYLAGLYRMLELLGVRKK